MPLRLALCATILCSSYLLRADDAVVPLPSGDELAVMGSEIVAEAEPSLAGFSTRALAELDRWKGEFAAGLNGAEGNTELFNSRVGLDTTREGARSDMKFNITYAKGSARGVDTENQLLHNWRNEWKLGESPWKPFTYVNGQYDVFQAFDYRLISGVGTAYQIRKTETADVQVRVGSGVSKMFGGEDEEWKPEANLGGDWKYTINERHSLTAGFEYFPNYTDFGDFRLNSKAAWEIMVEPSWQLGLRLGVIDLYQSRPQGAKSNDINYFVELVKKF